MTRINAVLATALIGFSLGSGTAGANGKAVVSSQPTLQAGRGQEPQMPRGDETQAPRGEDPQVRIF